jgi:hypothetical protein
MLSTQGGSSPQCKLSAALLQQEPKSGAIAYLDQTISQRIWLRAVFLFL